MAVIKYEVKVDSRGTQEWYLDYKLHRENGPAVVYVNGDQYWYKHGKCHREDGPAIIHENGDKFWFLDGKKHSEKCFNEKMKPVDSCSGKVVDIDGKKYKLVEI